MFPRDGSELEKIATPLIPPLESDLFDDVIRFYYIYLIIEVEVGGFTPTLPVSDMHSAVRTGYKILLSPGTTHLVHYGGGEENLPAGHNWMQYDRRVGHCRSCEVWV